MLKRNTLSTLILCGFVFASPLSSSDAQGASGQPLAQITPGVAIKDVDVKLTRYGGAQFNSGSMSTFRTTTNEKGEYRFPVVPKGEYLLTVVVSEAIQGQLNGINGGTSRLDGKIDTVSGKHDTRTNSAISTLLITISDASGKRGIGWDIGKNKAFDPTKDPAQQSTERTPGQKEPNIVVSDGATRCDGIVKSRSNIKTN